MKKVVFKFNRSKNDEFFWNAFSRGKTGDREIARSSETYKNLGDCVHSLGLIISPVVDEEIVILAESGIVLDALKGHVDKLDIKYTAEQEGAF